MKELRTNNLKIVLVDDDLFDYLNQWIWYAQKSKNKSQLKYYVYRNEYLGDYKHKKIYIHRLIMGITDPKIQIDHRDRNPLNNQKSNLRICQQVDNNQNRESLIGSTSKYLGVSYNKARKKWIVYLSKKNKTIYIGGYNSEKEAALIYNEKAKELYGEFANLNII